MITFPRLLRLVDIALSRGRRYWNAYNCVNDVQDLWRASLLVNDSDRGYELQFNDLVHAEVPHRHDCDMALIVLRGGYWYDLKQYGASDDLQMFAAPGSVLTMGPNDTHAIYRLKNRSLSFCVFSSQTDWHKRYPALTSYRRGKLLNEGLWLLERWRNGIAHEKRQQQ